jgi:hypothetical protein
MPTLGHGKGPLTACAEGPLRLQRTSSRGKSRAAAAVRVQLRAWLFGLSESVPPDTVPVWLGKDRPNERTEYRK